MTITAAQVKELRERTNAGMMDCKKALIASGGDIEKAIAAMQEAGQANAIKKAGRTASEGTIIVLASSDGKRGVLVEVNCETDFVAREEKFKQFAKTTGEKALAGGFTTCEALQKETDADRLTLVGQLGENVTVRRLAFHEVQSGVIGFYAHGDANGVRIGVLVVLTRGTFDLARDLAMQIAAMNPEYLAVTDVPDARKAAASEITLLGQPFLKDPAKTVEVVLKEKDAAIASFVRFEVGEGIEKKEDNFVAEVMAQIR
ncbi:MAG TPA: translation elongation factor Ts [Gammaproteobacteria bacterium]|nr:translation elongation factor Ts [Gammaproteobacteria bacterium]HRA42316.1 translation elongation factor Ts [Gammaproteobacteria bacterium]